MAYYPAFSANPSLIQGHYGKKGNFEVVTGNAYGGLVHIWRNNDDTSLPWKGATTFAGGIGEVGGVSLIEGNFGSPGNLEVVVNGGGNLLHFWRDSKDLKWSGATKVSPDLKAAGVPSFVQGTWGTRGNFELVSPVATGGGLVHYSRNNDASNFPWSPPAFFGKESGSSFTSVSLIQSNYGKHLEIIAISKEKLYFTWRDDSFKWAAITPIETEYTVTGNPALIQSKFGKKGNFELVVPAASGGLYHFWRDNNDGTKPSVWSKAVEFGQSEGVFKGVSLIQSNYGDGNLEVVAEKDGLLFHYYRVGGTWNGPVKVAPS